MNNKSNYNSKIIILCILAITIITRLAYFDKDSLWLDEGYSYVVATSPFYDMLSISTNDTNMLLHPLFLHFWLKLIAGKPETGRLFSVVIGVLTVIAGIILYQKLFKSSWFTPALFIACSPYLIYFSQEMRCYALFLFFGILSSIFFLNTFDSGKKKYVISYLVTSILLFYTHVYGLFIPFAHFLYLFIYQKYSIISIKKWLLLLAIPYSSLLIYLPFLLSKTSDVASREYPHFLNLILVFVDFSGGIPLAIIVFLTGIAVLFMLKKQLCLICREKGIVFLLILIVSNTLLPFIVSLTLLPIFVDRYTINASIPFLFLIFVLVGKLENIKIRYAIITVLLISALSMTIIRTLVQTREPWRDIARDLETELKPGVGLVVGDEWCYDYALKIYLKHNTNLFTIAQEKFNLHYLDTSSNFKTFSSSNNEFFVIGSHFPKVIQLKEKLNKSFRLVRSSEYTYFDRYFRKTTAILLFHFQKTASLPLKK